VFQKVKGGGEINYGLGTSDFDTPLAIYELKERFFKAMQRLICD
jgi:hypothetical protein